MCSTVPYTSLHVQTCCIHPGHEAIIMCLRQGTAEAGMPGYDYEPAAFAGWIWNRTRAVESLGRAYNYPHQTSIYHSMYCILKENNLVSARQPALWYLKQAAMTVKVPTLLA